MLSEINSKKDISYIHLDCVDSTNNYAKNNYKDFESKFTIVAADIQTAGKGRLGRSFYSDNVEGAWFSIAIKPEAEELTTDSLLLLPIMAAAAVSSSLQDIYGISVGIKWPNDILIEGKKVCGILCESRAHSSGIDLAVIGIGINVLQTEMPSDISSSSASMYMITKQKAQIHSLITNICGNVLDLYDKIVSMNYKYILSLWNEYSLMKDRDISYTKDNITHHARAKGIDEKGRLIVVRNEECILLDSNEIRLRIEGAGNDAE